MLENPDVRGQASITGTLYAGLQMLLPGESAPRNRHNQSALRFSVEGKGAFTRGHGEHTPMHTGDIILTPHGRRTHPGSRGPRRRDWRVGLELPVACTLR
ncbi:cupin domain-containing protein, partial [Salmonella enterica]|uniref:cupin domain-containing protein n=1 Tax=Salmonella enterica TaxID=28901 RepID=UPI00398C4563